jgi:signal transduction histidine kinase
MTSGPPQPALSSSTPKGPIARLRGSSLGVKLALLCAALTVGVMATALLALRAAAVGDVRRVVLTELTEGQQSWRRQQTQRLHLLLATSSLVSTSPTLRAALATARDESTGHQAELVATIQRETERVFGDLDRDLLVVTNENGHVLSVVTRGQEPWDRADLSTLPAVRYALAADTPTADSSFELLRAGGQTYQVGCAAIVLQGYPIGVLLLGDRVERVVPQLDSSTRSTAMVTVGRTVLQSAGVAVPPETAAQLRPEAGNKPYPVEVDGEEFLAATLPLGLTEDGQPAAVHLLRSVSGSLRPLDRTLTRSFIAAGLLAMLVVGFGAAAASRSMLGPLSRFVAFLNRRTDGPAFALFEEPGATVEVHTLVEAYNGLIESLRQQHAELEARSQALAQANEDLRTQMRERGRAEDALRESELQLRQAQKLEALGRLASGVAHDFNNLLMVIASASHFLRDAVPADSVHREDLDQIAGAAERAKTLVRQLLAFSRKQVLQPRILSLNEVVTGLEPLLRRLIGSRINLETRLEAELEPVRADPGQLEQVVMNLVVNASDAMADGGLLRIETGNVVLEQAYEHRPEALPGGPAVMLAVADSGIGMSAETRMRIFEPFFTTKPPGKGTGLGLSTVYGIVRQSGGSISVFSEPGQGTTFRIYLPVASLDEAVALLKPDKGQAPRGTETVLLAEDEVEVRSLVRRALQSWGYRVLEAGDGPSALELAGGHAGPIHLLVTDIMMPEMSGPEVARRLRAVRPEVRVILLSGSEQEEATPPGSRFDVEMTLLRKPVTPDIIARMVRDVLDAEIRTTPG